VRLLALPLLALVALAVAAVTAFGTAANGTTSVPVASASGSAIRISVPGQADITTTTAVAPPPSSPVAAGAFSYPADGSILTVQSTAAAASTEITANAAAKAGADASGLSLFGGQITIASVTARASAGTGRGDAGGNFLGSLVAGLAVDGQPTTAGRVTLGDWGTLTIGAQTIDRTAPAGSHGYAGSVTELDLRLTAAHGGLPAGSEIAIGYAAATAQTAPPGTGTARPASEPPVGDRPQLLPKSTPATPLQRLRRLHPKLTAGTYVFPVYGQTSYTDTFGAHRADVTYHHGDDIFGQLGQPLVACVSGTLYSVGFNKVGGNRLWIRDAAGNEFYYAHLSAFASVAADGAHVRAGEVVGFMGNTGDAEGTPVHLHFEVHPVSLLYRGYDGAVDPTRYLAAWRHAKDIPFAIAAGWVPPVPGGGAAPEPGAMLLGVNDISSADGLDPATLRQALRPAEHLRQTLVPTPVPRGVDLGTRAGAGA
jgi:murein DD-endopeptidase MepM/ murein hydrolase activator NlpD